MTDITKKHQDDLDYITKTLKGKPMATRLIRQMLVFNSNSLLPAKVVYPTQVLPIIEFVEELSEAGLLVDKVDDDIVATLSESAERHYLPHNFNAISRF